MRLFHSKDYPALVRWYKARGEEPPPFDTLPVVGLIVSGVAALFMYRTDSSVAILEGLIANPEASLRERSAATTALVEGLVKTAKEEGFRHVIASTKSEGVQRRASRLGFRSTGRFVTMAKAV